MTANGMGRAYTMPARTGTPTCEKADCDRPPKAHGLCERHYQRERQHRHRSITRGRLIAKRARNRATKTLIDRYRPEFEQLLGYYRDIVGEEYDRLAEQTNTTQPIRLLPGPRPDDHDLEDRVNLATPPPASCGRCGNYHAAGHLCPDCAERDAMLVDPVAVDQCVRGDKSVWRRLNAAERREVVAQLTQLGRGYSSIAEWVGESYRAIERMLDEDVAP